MVTSAADQVLEAITETLPFVRSRRNLVVLAGLEACRTLERELIDSIFWSPIHENPIPILRGCRIRGGIEGVPLVFDPDMPHLMWRIEALPQDLIELNDEQIN